MDAMITPQRMLCGLTRTAGLEPAIRDGKPSGMHSTLITALQKLLRGSRQPLSSPRSLGEVRRASRLSAER